MIDKKHAGNEVARLIGLNYFPSDPKALRELVTALSFARNEIIATAVINEWLEASADRPTPADIRRLVAAHNGAQEEREKRGVEVTPTHFDCRTCRDEGFYGGYLEGRFAGPWKWCTCSAAYDARERNAELVAEANIIRDKLLALFCAERARKGIRNAGAAVIDDAEAYHGQF